ncbi:hypothetical protein E2L06_04085 [Haloterrigena sp. H1]|uniref:hypothetical protein n=1 Tax=Haloterrigena sp. H1 TaxID=2552943 RepID=UPI00110EAECC|nr:hypothetical protein [Haloterrigena sp. H1]TMT85813.1 hypothetical protein E2L06_04085 [Haloterrigena sp. H1]
MQPKPCNDKAVELLWFENALTDLCGLAPERTDDIVYLSREVDVLTPLVAESDRVYHDDASTLSRCLVQLVLNNTLSWDSARLIFVGVFNTGDF